jgi:S1-C subfamily serine protease
LDARAEAETSLKQLLSEIAGKLSDPDFGPLIGAALLLDGPDDIWVVDRKPVLVNWGIAPVEAQGSIAARETHFAHTLGRFLPLSAAPAISREEWLGRGYSGAVSQEEEVMDPAQVNAVSNTPAQGVGAVPPAPPVPPVPPGEDISGEPERWRWRWIAPVGLAVLFGALLIWLLIPGSLIYPARHAGTVIDESRVADAARAANRALEERIASLRGAIDGAVCTPRGDLVLPGGLTPDGRAPLPRDITEIPPRDAPITARPDPLAPPPPSRLVQPSAGGGDPVSLLATLEAGVAMVLAQGEGEAGHGTGFFITPDLIITNHHVVKPALSGGRVFITNKALGEVRPAEIVATLGPLEGAGADFALLRSPGANGRPLTVRTPQEPIMLQQVIAAGYPGFALETDAAYQALMQGDGRATPGIIVTDGIVNAQQQLGPETNVVMHTAHISPGNSGGPLVDACGQVVGVNTFIRNDETSLSSLNFALATSDLVAFLQGSGASATLTEAGCVPSLSPPPQAAAGEP